MDFPPARPRPPAGRPDDPHTYQGGGVAAAPLGPGTARSAAPSNRAGGYHQDGGAAARSQMRILASIRAHVAKGVVASNARKAWLPLILTLALAGCGGRPASPSGSAASGTGSNTSTSSASASGSSAASAATGSEAPPRVTSSHVATLSSLAGAPPTTLSAVSFLNAQDGWLGATGRVGVTADGGSRWSWHPIQGVVVDSFSFAQARVGWLGGRTAACQAGPSKASGCADVLARTTDGGAQWSVQKTVPCGLQPVCAGPTVHFADARRGWALVDCQAAGAGGRPCRTLLATTDAGSTWTQAHLPAGFMATGLDVVSSREVWLAGVQCGASAQGPGVCPTALEHTSDGGRTWSAAGLPGKLTGGGQISFATASDGWLLPSPAAVCTMGGCWLPLYVTTDGGRTWTKLASSYQHSGFQGSPQFVNATTGFIPIQAGAGIGVGGVARTTDGGRTWSSVGGARRWSIASLSAVSPRDVWAIGGIGVSPATGRFRSGFLVHSSDGGRTWRQQLPVARPQQAIDFLNRTTGFGLGTASDPGAVLSTGDGGATWREVASLAATHAWLSGVSFANRHTGWAAGLQAGAKPFACCKPLLLRTLDGGRTWKAVGRRTRTVLGLRLFSPRSGVIVSSKGAETGGPAVVQATADGGRTWTARGPVPTGQQLIGVGFASPNAGWALTFRTAKAKGSEPSYQLERTLDGGRQWAPAATLPFGEGATSIFTGRSRGVWVLQPQPGGQSTMLLHTSGSGGWQRWRVGLADIGGADFGVRGSAWLLTPRGLWHSADGGAHWTQIA